MLSWQLWSLKVGWCLQEKGDGRWTVVEVRRDLIHVVFYQDWLHAVNIFHDFVAIDVGPPIVITPIPVSKWTFWRTTRFDVYRVDRLSEEPKLMEVESLGEWMLFLGINRSMSFDAKGHRGWRGNCVRFITSPSYYGKLDGEDRVWSAELWRRWFWFVQTLPLCHDDNSQHAWPRQVWLSPDIFSSPVNNAESGIWRKSGACLWVCFFLLVKPWCLVWDRVSALVSTVIYSLPIQLMKCFILIRIINSFVNPLKLLEYKFSQSGVLWIACLILFCGVWATLSCV